MKEEWLEQAYVDFAEHGPQNISINRIAKRIGTSRSSFYHYFSDIDILIDELLEKHYAISKIFNQEGKHRCKRLFPDLYRFLAEFPIPLKFSRQLFLNRSNPQFNYLYTKIYEESAHIFILNLFKKEIRFKGAEVELLRLFNILGDAWYSRLDPEDLSPESLQLLSEMIINNLMAFIKSPSYSSLRS